MRSMASPEARLDTLRASFDVRRTVARDTSRPTLCSPHSVFKDEHPRILQAIGLMRVSPFQTNEKPTSRWDNPLQSADENEKNLLFSFQFRSVDLLTSRHHPYWARRTSSDGQACFQQHPREGPFSSTCQDVFDSRPKTTLFGSRGFLPATTFK